jgi:amino-acid N-acetyltransferase
MTSSEKSVSLMSDKIYDIVIEPPGAEFIQDIFSLIDEYAKAGLLLPLTEDQIKERLDTFFVAFIDKKLVACVSLRNFGDKLFEIRSLAVDKQYSKMGIGSKIVAYILNDVMTKIDQPEVFALTYQVSFFMKLGFRVVDKDIFPQKIWSDCSNCPKFANCDETAVLFTSKSSIEKHL